MSQLSHVTGKQQAAGRSAPESERFPPLTTTLEAFLSEGSDAALRRLIYDLFGLSALMVRNRELFADFLGVTHPQFMIISIVAEDSTSTVAKIATRLGVSSQFMATEVAKLDALAIIERRPNKTDRRSMLLSLTEKGKSLIKELGPVRRRINDLTFRSLTRDRAGLLQEILTGLIADARTANHELQSPDLKGKKAPSAQAESAPISASSNSKTGRGKAKSSK